MAKMDDNQQRSLRYPRWQRAREVLQEAIRNFWTEDSLAVAASIAYYSILSLFPLLLLLLEISGIFIRRFELSGSLAVVLDNYLPMKPDVIMRNLVGISRAYGRVGIISFLLLLWGSSGVFMPLEKALNRAWEVKVGRAWIRRRLLALEMATIFGVLILASSFLVAANVYIHNWMKHWNYHLLTPLIEFGYHAAILAATFGLTLLMFIVLFQRLPNRPLQARQVLPSALLTAVFWEAVRGLLTLVLPFFNYRQVYGSIGVVVALMTWAYISSTIMLFGAQISRVLYRSLKIPGPADTAEIPDSARVSAPEP
jgi:membrane protein